MQVLKQGLRFIGVIILACLSIMFSCGPFWVAGALWGKGAAGPYWFLLVALVWYPVARTLLDEWWGDGFTG